MALTYQVNEQSTAFYSFSLVDENDTAIAASTLEALTLTLTDDATGAVINSRSSQDVLNTNGVAANAQGHVSWEMSPADNAIVGSPVPDTGEGHTAVFRWTWDSGTRSAAAEFRFSVIKISRVAVVTPPEEIPLPDLTGNPVLDTYNSLLVERLRVSRAGPLVTYNVDSQSVSWGQYLKYLDERILAIRIELSQVPFETVSVIR